jgi:cation diffusion facilitator CzcD-associated flavoprotein CzcO
MTTRSITRPRSRSSSVPTDTVQDVEALVIGGGQAGLSAAHVLAQRGFVPHEEFVLLDANDSPGGAWQHRWPSLTMDDVHGVHALPGMAFDPTDDDAPAREAVARYFDRYERHFELPIVRPVSVERVEDDGERLVVHADAGTWRTRILLNATGTWTRPFLPAYPGASDFRGRQLHTVDYRSADEFAGQDVVVVGGGHSAVQLLAEIAEVATTTWVTRRPPRWREGPFDANAGREAVAMVRRAVAAGRRPDSVVSVTGLALTPQVEAARERGVLHRRPVFDRITPDGVAWDREHEEGSARDEVRADAILWATGFRHALDHLAPLGLRDAAGGIRMEGTRVAADPRIHLLGYGPSASTIGANRAARDAVREVRRTLARA